MPTFKYVIRINKSSLNKDNSSLILLRYTHRGKVTYFTSRKRIDIDYWDSKRGRVKKSYLGQTSFNIYLSKFRQRIENVVNDAMFKNIDPSIHYVRRVYTDTILKDENFKRSSLNFEEFCVDFIDRSKLTKKEPTIKSYKDSLHVLDIYKKSRTISRLEYDDFHLQWYNDFMNFYIEERGASNNTFGKHIKSLKAILNEATRLGYNQSLIFRDKNFKVLKEEVNHIYLNELEIQSLLNVNYSNNYKRCVIRDLFVIACYTGIRFGDFKQIDSKNIQNGRFKLKTQKTGNYVVIPLHPIVSNIISKYSGQLPKGYCNNVINNELKFIGKDAGLNDSIIQVRTHGLERIEKTFKKYQLLSTHCARRSFATNLYKQGFPSISIMKITGHKSEKTFMRYIKISEDEVATMLEKHWSKNKK